MHHLQRTRSEPIAALLVGQANENVFNGKPQAYNRNLLIAEAPTGNIREKLKFSGDLGIGGRGIVRLVSDVNTGKRVGACKTIPKNKLKTKESVQELRTEVSCMRTASGHPNIIRLLSLFEDEQAVHLVVDLCEGGDLYEFLLKHPKVPEALIKHVARQIIDALRHCHECGILHRDVKPENILLSKSFEKSEIAALAASILTAPRDADDFVTEPETLTERRESQLESSAASRGSAGSKALCVKLADFGEALFLSPGQKTKGLHGSLMYIAPEIASKRAYGFAADIWSMGVLLYFALSGLYPFSGSTDSEVLHHVKRGKVDFSSYPWPSISEPAKDFVRWLLTADPNSRPTATEALSHPWLKADAPLSGAQRIRAAAAEPGEMSSDASFADAFSLQEEGESEEIAAGSGVYPTDVSFRDLAMDATPEPLGDSERRRELSPTAASGRGAGESEVEINGLTLATQSLKVSRSFRNQDVTSSPKMKATKDGQSASTLQFSPKRKTRPQWDDVSNSAADGNSRATSKGGAGRVMQAENDEDAEMDVGGEGEGEGEEERTGWRLAETRKQVSDSRTFGGFHPAFAGGPGDGSGKGAAGLPARSSSGKLLSSMSVPKVGDWFSERRRSGKDKERKDGGNICSTSRVQQLPVKESSAGFIDAVNDYHSENRGWRKEAWDGNGSVQTGSTQPDSFQTDSVQFDLEGRATQAWAAARGGNMVQKNDGGQTRSGEERMRGEEGGSSGEEEEGEVTSWGKSSTLGRMMKKFTYKKQQEQIPTSQSINTWNTTKEGGLGGWGGHHGEVAHSGIPRGTHGGADFSGFGFLEETCLPRVQQQQGQAEAGKQPGEGKSEEGGEEEERQLGRSSTFHRLMRKFTKGNSSVANLSEEGGERGGGMGEKGSAANSNKKMSDGEEDEDEELRNVAFKRNSTFNSRRNFRSFWKK